MKISEVEANDILGLTGRAVYFHSTACATLRMEDGILAGHLGKSNLIVSEPEKADIIFFSTCGVTAEISELGLSQIKELRSRSKAAIYVGGCMPEAEKWPGDSGQGIFMFSTKKLYPFFNDNRHLTMERSPTDSARPFWVDNLEKKIAIRDGLAGISGALAEAYEYTTEGLFFANELQPPSKIAVSTGCSMKCSYCSIPQSRGGHASINRDKILSQVKTAVEKGADKIVLMGENIGQYGIDLSGKDRSFDSLIHGIAALSKDVRIALRYIEPHYLLRFKDAILDLAEKKRIYFIGSPVQSASPKVLKEMNRPIELKEFVKVLTRLRRLDGLFLGTNFINGFPGETGEDHKMSVEMINKIGFDVAAAIPFSARKGTPAYHFGDKVPKNVIDERHAEMKAAVSGNRRKRLAGYIEKYAAGKSLASAQKSVLRAAVVTD